MGLLCRSTFIHSITMATIFSTIRGYENAAHILFKKPFTTRTPSLRFLTMKTKVGPNDKQFEHSSQVQPLFGSHHELNNQATYLPLENQPPLFDFDKYMAMKKKIIHKALDEAVPLQHPNRLHEEIRYSLFPGGKGIYSVLCLAVCELVGGDESLAIPIACAAEMIKAYMVIHDDLPCMDNDDFRHGKPSTHKAFEEETAILAGNALLTLGFQHIATMKGIQAEQLVRCISEFGSACGSLGAMGGQFMDLCSEGKDVTLEELEYIHVHKSAKYIQAVLVCGAIIGGGNEIQVQKLSKFALFLGLLIQVGNDISDVTKSSEELGKTAGTDLLSDKATYPKLMGIQGTKKFASELLNQVYQELANFDAARAAPMYGVVNYIYRYYF